MHHGILEEQTAVAFEKLYLLLWTNDNCCTAVYLFCHLLTGMVTIESPGTTVCYQSSPVLKCVFEEATGSAGWNMSSKNESFELNNGSVVQLNHSCSTEKYKSCVAVTLHRVTGLWAGKYRWHALCFDLYLLIVVIMKKKWKFYLYLCHDSTPPHTHTHSWSPESMSFGFWESDWCNMSVGAGQTQKMLSICCFRRLFSPIWELSSDAAPPLFKGKYWSFYSF